MNEGYSMRDPTSEGGPATRPRLAPPDTLQGCCIALLDIGKERSDEFLDSIEVLLAERQLQVRRYAKPSPVTLARDYGAADIAAECDVVIEALAD